MRHDKTLETSADLSKMSDLCTPWCTHVVTTLRIADHIEASTTDIKTLSEKAECNADFLQRVLRHLVGKGVFPEVLLTRDWEKVKTVVDVGGGTGALLAEILRARPEI